MELRRCMSVYACVYVSVCCMYVCMCIVCMHVCVCLCVYACVCVCACVRVWGVSVCWLYMCVHVRDVRGLLAWVGSGVCGVGRLYVLGM